MNKNILVFVLAVTLALGNTVPAFSQNYNQSSPPQFVQMIIKLINDTAWAIKTKMPNLDRFVWEFRKYQAHLEAKMPKMLEDFTRAIAGYAEHQGSLVESSDSLFEQLGRFNDKIWQAIAQFPQIKTLVSIVDPILRDFTREIRRALPNPRPHNPGDNPMATVHNFYNDMGQTNPLGLGPFFNVQMPRFWQRNKSLAENSRETTTKGFARTDVRYRKTVANENSELVSYELLVNNKVVKYYVKPEDLTVLHGMPREMRRDGVDENVIRFSEEYINLSNINLVEQHRENGLIIDPNHPQLKTPQGYSMDIFIRNFSNLLENWKRRN